MMTELLSHEPFWGFRRMRFSSQSKHVLSEVIHSNDVLLFITHQQHTASELLWSSRVQGCMVDIAALIDDHV